MKKFSIKPDYEYSLRRGLSQQLLLSTAFIEQQNYQTQEYVTSFSDKLKNGGGGITVDHDREYVIVSNINNHDFDLNEVFTNELPNHIRKSQLLMLWSMLEDTLKFIVEKLSLMKTVPIRRKEKGESIFIHLIKQVEKINGKQESIQLSISFLNDNVRKVRNSIVHGNKVGFSYSGFEETEYGLNISDVYIDEVCSAIHCIGYHL